MALRRGKALMMVLATAITCLAAGGAGVMAQEEEEPMQVRPNPVDDALMGTRTGGAVPDLPRPGDVGQTIRKGTVNPVPTRGGAAAEAAAPVRRTPPATTPATRLTPAPKEIRGKVGPAQVAVPRK